MKETSPTLVNFRRPFISAGRGKPLQVWKFQVLHNLQNEFVSSIIVMLTILFASHYHLAVVVTIVDVVYVVACFPCSKFKDRAKDCSKLVTAGAAPLLTANSNWSILESSDASFQLRMTIEFRLRILEPVRRLLASPRTAFRATVVGLGDSYAPVIDVLRIRNGLLFSLLASSKHCSH